MTDRPLKRGPKGGVYYIARSGARVYVDRSSLPARFSRSDRNLQLDAQERQFQKLKREGAYGDTFQPQKAPSWLSGALFVGFITLALWTLT